MKYLCQSSAPWGPMLLGLSTTTTYGRAGCLATTMAELCRMLGIDAAATPQTIVETAIARWRAGGSKQDAMPFIKLPADEKKGREPGANAVTVDVGRANGLLIGDRLDAGGPKGVGVKGLIDAFIKAQAAGGFAIAHVDTDAADADHNGKHWVTLDHGVGPVVIYRDPAIGAAGQLSATTGEGPAGWGKPRTFALRGLRTVHRA